jgi:hypothetical protein
MQTSIFSNCCRQFGVLSMRRSLVPTQVPMHALDRSPFHRQDLIENPLTWQMSLLYIVRGKVRLRCLPSTDHRTGNRKPRYPELTERKCFGVFCRKFHLWDIRSLQVIISTQDQYARKRLDVPTLWSGEPRFCLQVYQLFEAY